MGEDNRLQGLGIKMSSIDDFMDSIFDVFKIQKPNDYLFYKIKPNPSINYRYDICSVYPDANVRRMEDV